MTTPASGAISMSQVWNEFDGSEGNPLGAWNQIPISLNNMNYHILGGTSGSSTALGTSYYSKSCAHATAPASSSNGTDWNNAANMGEYIPACYTELTAANSFTGGWAVGTNWGFSLPSSAIIRGICVGFSASWEEPYGSDNTYGANVYMYVTKNGGASGTDFDASAITNSEIQYRHPDTTYQFRWLWSSTWTYSEINSSNFGVMIYAYKNGGNGVNPTRINVGTVRMHVQYDT